MYRLSHVISVVAAMSVGFGSVCCVSHSSSDRETERLILLSGSYSPSDSMGVKVWSFDPASGHLTLSGGVKGISNPSFVHVSDDGRRIYSVGEDAAVLSSVNMIRFDADSLRMTLESSDTIGGGAPCYVNLSPDDRYVLTANYHGGNVTIYALDSAGKPVGDPQILSFEHGDPSTQSKGAPRLHSVTFTPDSSLLVCADLGTDRLHVFPLNGSGAKNLVDANRMTDVELKPHSGPRHIVYSKRGTGYLINEISGEVTVLERRGDSFEPVQYIASDTVGGHGSGDIHLSPDERFLYTSNRLKADGIAVFAIDSATGRLTRTGYMATGPHPRNFALSPDGRWLLVACRDNDRIEVYARDSLTGQLTPTDHYAVTPNPVCLKFAGRIAGE